MYNTFTQIRNELRRREGAFDQVKRTVIDCQAKAHHLFSEQETMKRQVQQLGRAIRQENREKFGLIDLIRPNKEQLLNKIQELSNLEHPKQRECR